MIDRAEYLQMCRECAMIRSRGVSDIPMNVPDELKVVYNGKDYYPDAYTIYFNMDGSPVHIAEIHDLKANAVFNVLLKDVEKKKRMI